MYIRSAEADCADDVAGGYYRASCAREVLAGPDERLASTLAREPTLLGARSRIFSRALWTGLLPFGSRAALASTSEHVPRVTPELQDVLALFRGSPSWRGLASLFDIRAVLATNTCLGQAVGVPLDATLFLHDLVSLLVTAPICGPAMLHEALAVSCRAALGTWSAGATTATAAFALVSRALDAFCDAASTVAASSTHAPPGGSRRSLPSLSSPVSSLSPG